MNESLIEILYVPMGAMPEKKTVENTLKAFQQLVEGYIETVFLGSGCVLVCNEEGRLNGMEPNVFVPQMMETIHGPFFIAGYDGGEDFTSLADEPMEKFMTIFRSMRSANAGCEIPSGDDELHGKTGHIFKRSRDYEL